MDNLEVRVASAVADDVQIAAESDPLVSLIERAVQSATGGRVHQFRVDVAEDSIRLQGYCATFHCNQLAQTAAMEVAGDRAVDNRIVVW